MTETEGSLILKNFNFPEFGGYYKKKSNTRPALEAHTYLKAFKKPECRN
jgi:hypothetical protein